MKDTYGATKDTPLKQIVPKPWGRDVRKALNRRAQCKNGCGRTCVELSKYCIPCKKEHFKKIRPAKKATHEATFETTEEVISFYKNLL